MCVCLCVCICLLDFVFVGLCDVIMHCNVVERNEMQCYKYGCVYCTNTHTHIYRYIYICTYILHVYIYMCVYVCICTYISTHGAGACFCLLYIYTHTYIYIYTCTLDPKISLMLADWIYNFAVWLSKTIVFWIPQVQMSIVMQSWSEPWRKKTATHRDTRNLWFFLGIQWIPSMGSECDWSSTAMFGVTFITCVSK